MWQDDTQYTEHVISEVRPADVIGSDGPKAYWELCFDEGWCILCPGNKCSTEPKPGESVRLFGKGIGYEVRGIVIAERVYSYLTEKEAEDAREAAILKEKQNRQRQLDEERPERDKRIAALPEPLRLRIERFQRVLPDWRRDHEAYELFVCEEAAKIVANMPKNADTTATLRRLNDDDDLAKQLGMSIEEHSGNTFGMSVALAHMMFNSPQHVPHAHGALCAMVGCKEYGCFAAYGDK